MKRYIKASSNQESYRFLKSKSVMDSDGFYTDYTLYEVTEDGDTKYVCIFGDNDMYNPDNTFADFESDDYDEAIDWYLNYNGFADDEDVEAATDAEDEDENDLTQLPQEYTSERTSTNKAKLPAIFTLVKNWAPGTINLDYGGGKYDNGAEHLAQFDATNLVYDPYNRTAEHNRDVIKTIRDNGGADSATLSNVLNVIKEPEVRRNVLENIKKLLKPGANLYITVYEGSKDSVEGPTTRGYQLNRMTADYLDEIQEVFPNASRKGKLITAINSATEIDSCDEMITL